MSVEPNFNISVIFGKRDEVRLLYFSEYDEWNEESSETREFEISEIFICSHYLLHVPAN